MVQLIAGNKGRGKTTELLNRVNTQIRSAKGSIVYLDKSSKHMYELNNKVRLIDVSRYPIENSDQFVGFICRDRFPRTTTLRRFTSTAS